MQITAPIGWQSSMRFSDTWILGNGEVMVNVQTETTPEGGENWVTRVLGYGDFDGRTMEYNVRRICESPRKDDAMNAARREMFRINRVIQRRV